MPKEVSDLLGVSAGDSVRVEVEGGKIVIRSQKAVPDFAAMIGKYPLDPEWDGLCAVEWQEEMRGDPDERATLHAAPPHPNVTRLSDLFGPLGESSDEETPADKAGRKPA